MDCQSLLEKQAQDQGLTLTALSRMNHYSQSVKIPYCGGVVVRVETESSADSTVCLRDDTGTCFCALHGDLTSRYPDVLSIGALLCFANITLLVTSAKMPPLLVACLENLVGLMLPDEDAVDGATSARASDSGAVLHAEQERFTEFALASGAIDPGAGGALAVGESLDAFFTQPSEPSRSAAVAATAVALPISRSAAVGTQARTGGGDHHPPLQAPKPTAKPTVAVKAELISDNDDDEDCLELVDDL